MDSQIKKGKISDIEVILKLVKPKNVLVVTGKSSFKTSGAKKIIEGQLVGYNVFYYSEFSTNPKIEEVAQGVALIRKFSPDIIIAVGGGSVIDTAKLICSLSEDLIESKKMILGQQPLRQRNFPMIAIPTTAGSGSECTHFAVVYLDDEKYSLANNSLLPNYIILDSTLTNSLPQKQTAIAALDAFCQSIESFWAVDSTEQSRDFAKESLQIILNNYEKVVSCPNNETRRSILRASYLAGKAINITKTTAPHALSYGLTIKYNIPHGHAVALTIGQFLILHAHSSDNNYNGSYNSGVLSERITELFKIIKVADGYKANVLIQKMIEKGGLETHLHKLGVNTKDELKELCQKVNYERLANNPVRISTDIAFQIYSKVF